MKVSSRKSSFIVYSVIIKVIKMIHMNLCIWTEKKNTYSRTTFTSVATVAQDVQGVPKKMSVKPNLEFQNLGGVFLGVENNSKNFGNKKIVGCLAKF